ncbi:hypothetical protein SteCoe_9983 [Stentor coeruleus]|uniref:Uncharacterized protein n=1 Tax=Stentor coeruleus TaxID=5963 RepID=A0A1R2CGN7_9CILI|nr:hypothetical protein SteCoe_9983 [Stentor coeruleus]
MLDQLNSIKSSLKSKLKSSSCIFLRFFYWKKTTISSKPETYEAIHLSCWGKPKNFGAFIFSLTEEEVQIGIRNEYFPPSGSRCPSISVIDSQTGLTKKLKFPQNDEITSIIVFCNSFSRYSSFYTIRKLAESHPEWEGLIKIFLICVGLSGIYNTNASSQSRFSFIEEYFAIDAVSRQNYTATLDEEARKQINYAIVRHGIIQYVGKFNYQKIENDIKTFLQKQIPQLNLKIPPAKLTCWDEYEGILQKINEKYWEVFDLYPSLSLTTICIKYKYSDKGTEGFQTCKVECYSKIYQKYENLVRSLFESINRYFKVKKIEVNVIKRTSINRERNCTSCRKVLEDDEVQYVAISIKPKISYCQDCQLFCLENANPSLSVLYKITPDSLNLDEIIIDSYKNSGMNKLSLTLDGYNCSLCKKLFSLLMGGFFYRCAHCTEFISCPKCYNKLDQPQDESVELFIKEKGHLKSHVFKIAYKSFNI